MTRHACEATRKTTYQVAARESLLDPRCLRSFACDWGLFHVLRICALPLLRTCAGRSHDDHANLFGGRSRASGALLELLDARVEVADNILELLELILNEAHGRGKNNLGIVS